MATKPHVPKLDRGTSDFPTERINRVSDFFHPIDIDGKPFETCVQEFLGKVTQDFVSYEGLKLTSWITDESKQVKKLKKYISRK